MKKSIPVLLSIAMLFSCGNEKKETNENEASAESTTELKTNLVVSVGKVEPEIGIVGISATTGGIVKVVYKNDGDNVIQDELLVQLDDDLEQSKINEIKTQIQSQRLQIEVEQTQLKEAEVNFNNKKSLLTKTKRLLESGAETQQVYDDLSTEIEALEVNMERSKAQIKLADSKMNEFVAKLKTAETEAQKKQFKSPFEGVLLDMRLNKGEAVNQFSTYAELAPKGNLIVRAEVDELFSSKIKTGQKVEIFYTGSNQVIAAGEIAMVSPYLKKKSLFSEKANDQEDRRVREIRIALNDADNLIINSKVECKIKL